MKGKDIARCAADWALSKVGYSYSQAKRTDADYFDCSSLVARAYSAQGKRWKYGGDIPTSMYEVYDDCFELLWPEDYDEIGRYMGGSTILNLARQAGDLQFLCTDTDTSRSNRITHVAMVCDKDHIVHARSTKYGVCTNDILLYSGKVCAVTRYNPSCTLRRGMCGWRTVILQEVLNAHGADLVVDGEYGKKTEAAVSTYQKSLGKDITGMADSGLLSILLNAE